MNDLNFIAHPNADVATTQDPGQITVQFLEKKAFFVNKVALCSSSSVTSPISPYCYVSRDGEQWMTVLNYSNMWYPDSVL